VFSFADGKTLDDLMDPSLDAGSNPRMCNAFAWKLLNKGLEVVSYAYSEGFSCGDAQLGP
jgi:hypothetical protein